MRIVAAGRRFQRTDLTTSTVYKTLRLEGDELKTSKGFILLLATIAGATTAIGFWIINQYRMLITGILFRPSANEAFHIAELLAGAVILSICFAIGAALSTTLWNWQHSRKASLKYSFPLLLQAVILTCAMLGGKAFNTGLLPLATNVLLFLFVLGMQNAMILSLLAEERGATYSSGIVTELGVELGNMVYPTCVNQDADKKSYRGNPSRLRLLIYIVALFICGVLIGTVGFTYLRGTSCFVLAAGLLLSAGVTMTRDLG